jgi:hypothetical protein
MLMNEKNLRRHPEEPRSAASRRMCRAAMVRDAPLFTMRERTIFRHRAHFIGKSRARLSTPPCTGMDKKAMPK